MTNNFGVRLLLKEAFKAFRKKRFSETIVLLKKVISNKPRDPYAYFLLCVTYLLCDRFSDAETAIKKLRNIDPEYLPLIQLEAFLLLKSMSNIHSVLSAYIDKIDRFPDDKYFKRAIRNLRRVENFSDFQKNAKLNSFVFIPKPSVRISDHFQRVYREPGKPERIKKNIRTYQTSYRKIIIITLAFCPFFAIMAASYYFYFMKRIPVISEKQKQLPIDSINIELLQYDLIDKILKAKPPVFYYTNDEVINDFNKAKYLIKNEKYNDALMIVNKISNSNANYRVKERNEFLRKFVSGLEFKNYSNIPVEKVFQKPYLYRGIFVEWKGKIVNLKRKDNKMLFNLLIDYEKDDIFNGIIDVYSEREYSDIKNGDMITIDGVFISTIGNDNRLYLVADSITKP